MNRRSFLHNLIATTIVTSIYPDKTNAEVPIAGYSKENGENNKLENFNQIDLSSSNAWKKDIYAGQQSLEERLKETASIFDFIQNKEDIYQLKNITGIEIDVSKAFDTAISSGAKSLFFPPVPGVYVLGNMRKSIPFGFFIYGHCRKPYIIKGDDSFNNTGTVIRLAKDAEYIFPASSYIKCQGIVFDGRNRKKPFLNHHNQIRGGLLEDCGLYRFSIGVGSYSYTSIYIIRCSISDNVHGISNLIDSKVIDSVINANKGRGVNLLKGANNNIFINVRNEWNEKENYYSDGSKQNIVSGEMSDRSGLSSFVARNGGSWLISNHIVKRSGRYANTESPDSSHFKLAGNNSKIYLSNVLTTTGVDDDGKGNISPAYVISTEGKSRDNIITATGCDFTGSLKTPIRDESNSIITNIICCLGIEDSVNSGIYQYTNGKLHIGKIIEHICVKANSSTNIRHVQTSIKNIIKNQPLRWTLEIIGFDEITNAPIYYYIPLIIQKTQEDIILTVLKEKVDCYPLKLWDTVLQTTIEITRENTLNITIKNNSANNYEISSTLSNNA
ncbi:hypothetical protein LVU53_03910 [Klebsiella pneumoniae]|uniref:hypothetical protein n=1 Tax=Klebsiella pneumoniae TaxID=573 RepID=UPI000DE68A01|nr:hypothetical protein [Klebsiella pneumoniae]ELB4867232.1 hypothetical protein [Klebsiella pneumoniae]MCA5345755.1 hypothetical protein [Klebsiella pneumoniae]MCA5361127.1 hypothetical protein [Klebsiella pneumoniae]MCE0276486.1 hypothetical protein [Klebsiella pneumoniae]MCI7876305.1 hypothetical protein [Klebsiella pneumoniae]